MGVHGRDGGDRPAADTGRGVPADNEAAAAALASGSDYTDEFEFSLDLILDGLERLRRVPAYLGPAGWLGLDLDERTDLEEVAELLEDSFRLTAPRASSPRSTAVGREQRPWG